MYKQFYQKFLEANQKSQHYASHSHHYWPDVTRQAQIQYWDDSARFVDQKWDYFFSQKVPQAQKLIAEVLNLTNPQQIVFAPNTHEFVMRLLSCFDSKKKIKILTTDSEFYSFDRQVQRYLEDQAIEVDFIPTQPFDSFESRFIQQIQNKQYDYIFFSHVFFNSGVVVQNLKKIVDAVVSPETVIAIDGYHGFMAIPTDLAQIENRIFYIAGSYKYAQGGEGACFMHIPTGCKLRPSYTGWFAGFSDLSDQGKKVSYSQNGYRFAGSTMDFSALYRLCASLELFKENKISVNQIHQHICQLQKNFLDHLKEVQIEWLKEDRILRKLSQIHENNHEPTREIIHGHFFALDLSTSENALKAQQILQKNQIITDSRKNILRFGFGLYQEPCIDLTAVKGSTL